MKIHGNTGKRGKPAWNKGLTKETDERVLRCAKPKSEETRKKMSKAQMGNTKALGKKFIFSEEHKRKLSEAMKGRPAWNKGLLGWNKGHVVTEATKQKMRKNNGMLGKHHSAEAIAKIIAAKIGKRLSEEIRRRMSESRIGKQQGEKNGMWGKHHSEEAREAMSKKRTGENNHNWRGGISKLPYTQDWTEDLKDSIRKRDEYKCQVCGISQDELTDTFFSKLDVHHIDYDKENCDPRNLKSLCHPCHVKTNYKREKWEVFFNDKKQVNEKERMVLCA